MTKADLFKFISWLETKEMSICGPVMDPLLGTHRFRPLHEDDREAVVSDFLDIQETLP